MYINITVPDKRIGPWEIQSFILTPAEADTHNAREAAGRKRYIHCNVHYKRLLRYQESRHFGEVIMSNTPAEVEDHWPFIDKASGDILIFGLGLGMVVQALIDKPDVETITVVEIDSNIIALSGNHYENLSKKVKILQADAFNYYTEQKYGAIWFDIWDRIDEENLDQMQQLKKRWRKNSPIRMCWAEDICRDIRREGKRFARSIGNFS